MNKLLVSLGNFLDNSHYKCELIRYGCCIFFGFVLITTNIEHVDLNANL